MNSIALSWLFNNPTTRIKYLIPQQSFVNMKVYDLLGREVAILVTEEKSAGNYEVEFNSTALSNGIYFCHLQSGNFVETKSSYLSNKFQKEI
ncbi:MAG: T9SS type A sorting domain-containing protein [Ignavibacteriaceae bacterium]|nr:T9SS type A sorting domain-containing protein [Ignavibacteriaceae bacterium]